MRREENNQLASGGLIVVSRGTSRISLGIQILEEGFRQHISILDVARRLNLSSSHLRHLFKVELGVSPHRYLRNLRLEHANNLVERTLLSIKEITYAIGYSDVSHFVRDYKKAFGKTPTETRRAAVRSLGERRDLKQLWESLSRTSSEHESAPDHYAATGS